MSRKGSGFERSFCKQLSLWWTGGEHDDCFWRTAGSGGRATSRGKKDKKTRGAYGDIAATDHLGSPLLDLITIEVKRGYSRHTIQDAVDKGVKAARQEYEGWILQAEASHKLAGSFSWAVVFRRDARRAMVMLPEGLVSQLRGPGAFTPSPLPFMRVDLEISGVRFTVVLMRLEAFFDGLNPDVVIKLARRL